jgi:mannitol/fructose-specific phosphotransferase system IIA component (Ntr-type)
MAIVLADLLDARHVELAVRSRTAANSIRELIALLAGTERITDEQQFIDQVIEREKANPSQVEDGVVFPHARTDLVEKIVLAIGRSRAGVPFGPNTERANLIFLIGVPQRLVSDYLVCVGALARIARQESIRTELMRAKTREQLIEILSVAAAPEGKV